MIRHARSVTSALLVLPALLTLTACGGGDAGAAEAGDEAEVEEQPAAPVVSSGTALTLQLSETVSTRSHEPGDPVRATVVDAVRGSDGSILIPNGATVSGAVEESRRSEGPESPAVLAFNFRTLTVGGQSYPLTATVEEANPEVTEGASDAESVAKIAIGTAAGALVGQILGGSTEATVGGAAAGTLAGAAVAITSKHGDATLREGSLITIRTREPIRLD